MVSGIGSRIFFPGVNGMKAASLSDGRSLAHFGSWKSTHQRFSRWCKSGVLDRVLNHLASDADAEYVMIDATIIRAH